VIVGQFRDRFPHILLTLHGDSGPIAVDFVLDTGFGGYLTLPESILHRLGAVGSVRVRSRLADGSIRPADAFTVALEWDGEIRQVEALAYENNPLLGTMAFDGCHIDIEA
jgi:clan AA aspartic protease